VAARGLNACGSLPRVDLEPDEVGADLPQAGRNVDDTLSDLWGLDFAKFTDHAMKHGYDYGDEFEYGLDAILDTLERAREAP
jgi:hypothetical protein